MTGPAEDESPEAPGDAAGESERAGKAKLTDSNVDAVLRDMEDRVRDLHRGSPHDTAVDLVMKDPTASAPRPEADRPASTAELLETWIRKNASTAVHFEPVGIVEPQRHPRRLGAALEVGRTHVRYLELQPYEGGRQVVSRFEQIALPQGPARPEERAARVASALAALAKRTGPMAPCIVLDDQGTIATRVLTVPVGTRAVDAAVRTAIGGGSSLASAKRIMGKIRVGTSSIKSVLVTHAPDEDVARLAHALRAEGVPAERISSSAAAFLETVVTKAARLDEDAAEAFVFVERASVTVSLAARAVLLVARAIPLEKEPGTPEWVAEAVERLKRISAELERACGGGELARIRYALALPRGVDFPTDEIRKAFGRPAELIDIELLFRIDLESVRKLAVPADAIGILAPAAYEATLDDGSGLDLGAHRASPAVIAVAWAFVAAFLVLVAGGAFAWEPAAELRRRVRDETAALEEQVRAGEPIARDHEAALALRAARKALDEERAALDDAGARTAEPAKLLRDLVTARPEGVFFERFHLARGDRAHPGFQLELTAVGTGETDKAAALVAELVLRLRQGSLADVDAKATPAGASESAMTIRATAGPPR